MSDEAGEARFAMIDDMQARIDALTAGYTEAIGDIADWGAYASEYFQQKHDLEGCIKAHKAILEDK